jgi:hypothetical protein
MRKPQPQPQPSSNGSKQVKVKIQGLLTRTDSLCCLSHETKTGKTRITTKGNYRTDPVSNSGGWGYKGTGV